MLASKYFSTCLLTIFSITLDTDRRRLTGLYLVLSVLFPLFLNSGMHLEIFQQEGKIPVSKELLMIHVRGVDITFTADLKTLPPKSVLQTLVFQGPGLKWINTDKILHDKC